MEKIIIGGEFLRQAQNILFLPSELFVNSDLESVKNSLTLLREAQSIQFIELIRQAMLSDNSFTMNEKRKIDNVFTSLSTRPTIEFTQVTNNIVVD